MEILKTNIDPSNKVLVYKLTKSRGTMVQEAPAGLSVPVADWMLYSDPKEGKDGVLKENKVLSFTDTSGVKYSTVSATFQREFLDIVEIMGADAFAILIVHGKTKANKDFVSCELDCDFFN